MMIPRHRPLPHFRNWLLAAGTLLSCAAWALDPAPWGFAQTVEVPAAGLTRLNLPPETLGAARANQEDVRLLDASGQEVPFLLERPTPEPERRQMAKSFRVSLENSTTVIVLESGLEEAVAAVSLESPARNFLKAVRLEGSHDGETWQELAAGQPIFRLPEGASALKIEFPAGRWEFFKLTLDDRRTEPVPITGAHLHFPGKASATQSVALAIKSRDESPGVTRLALDLGAANLRIAELEFETADPLFNRALSVAVPEVLEETIREQVIGEGFIHRVAVAGVTASQLRVPLERQIKGRELIVLIRNQDSPPLTISTVRATLRPTRLVFFARESAPLKLLTGNAQCPPARYDVATLSERLKSAPSQEARLGPLEANAGYQPAEPLPDLAEVGATLDLKPWAYRKVVRISAAGVQQLEVDPEVMSRANSTLSDLRLTRAGRQIPFLFETTSVSRTLDPQLTPAPDPSRPQVSRWMLQLPYPRLPLTRISLESSSTLFEREVRVLEKETDSRGEWMAEELGRALWRRVPGAARSDLLLRLERGPRSDTLYLETDNGDNPPIELVKVRAYYPVTRLVFKATPQTAPVELSYGNAQALAPRYDLSLIAPSFLQTARQIAATSPEPGATPTVPSEAMSLGKRVLFWGALALVVAGLLTVLARVLPKA